MGFGLDLLYLTVHEDKEERGKDSKQNVTNDATFSTSTTPTF